MTRRGQRESLIASGFAAAGCLLLAIVILKAGPGPGSRATADASPSALQADASTGLKELTARGATRDLPATTTAPEIEPFVDADRLPLTVPIDTITQISEPALSLPTGPSGRAAAGSDNSQPSPRGNSRSSARHRFRPGAGGGFAAAGFPIVGAAQASAVTDVSENRTERVARDSSTQTARVSGARAEAHQSTADSAPSTTESSPWTSDSAASSTTPSSVAPPSVNDSPSPSASLATLLEELTGANPGFGPIVVGGPEAFGGSGIEAGFTDVIDETVSLEAFAGNAREDLAASFALPGSNSGPAPVTATAAGGSTIVNPEPATLLLLGTGLGLSARYARRVARRTAHRPPR